MSYKKTNNLLINLELQSIRNILSHGPNH